MYLNFIVKMCKLEMSFFCVFQDFPAGDVMTFGVFASEPDRHSLAENRYVAKNLLLRSTIMTEHEVDVWNPRKTGFLSSVISFRCLSAGWLTSRTNHSTTFTLQAPWPQNCDKRHCLLKQAEAVNMVLKIVATLHLEIADICGFMLSSIEV